MKKLAFSAARMRGAEIAVWLLLAATFFLLPDKLALMSQILIFGLFAVALDMALGYAGILTVGHAAFFGAGAYAAGLLAKHGWGDPLLGLAVALLAAQRSATPSATSWCAAPTWRG
jgi:branched-chain amino acid transport system permease protein